MKTSAVDLQDKASDILKALDNNENVTVFYHGKIKGIIKPAKTITKKRIKEHPFYGMYKEHKNAPLDELDTMRRARYDI